MRIFTFDTTLRDGTQGEAISFSADDKVLIAHKLDELGIDYIEGGWPGSNPKDKEFFARAKDIQLKNARSVAFGVTRFARNKVEEDPSIQALIESGTPVVSIFGKSWDLHVKRALGPSGRKEAEEWTLRGEAIATEIGSRWGLAAAFVGGAELAADRGDADAASDLFARAISVGREVGVGRIVSRAELGLAALGRNADGGDERLRLAGGKRLQ